jgi:hypothetical protein
MFLRASALGATLIGESYVSSDVALRYSPSFAISATYFLLLIAFERPSFRLSPSGEHSYTGAKDGNWHKVQSP